MKAVISPILAIVLGSAIALASSLGTAFNYQGQLSDAGEPVSGVYDFRFALYDVASGGAPLTEPVLHPAIEVPHGLFTVALDFGAGVFDGEARWLEIAVRLNGETHWTDLTPRQPLLPAPHALYAARAGTAAAAETAATASSVAAQAVTTAGLADAAVTLPKLDSAGAAAGQAVFFDGIRAVWQAPPGDITEVLAGDGLSGGGSSGSVALGVAYAGSGTAATAARSDHTHSAAAIVSDTLDDARLPASVPRLAADQVYTGSNTFAPTADTPGVIVRQSPGAGPDTDIFTVRDREGAGSYFAVDGHGEPRWPGIAHGNLRGAIAGDGSGLSGLDAGQLATGTVPDARLAGVYSNPLTFSHGKNSFTGNGNGLVGLNADALASGVLPGPRLAGTYNGAVSLSNPGNRVSGVFEGDGASVQNLNAGNVASGTLSDTRLSANIARLNAAAPFTATVSAPSLQGGALVVDPANANTGTLESGAATWGAGSGEGIASKRSAGGNQYGLDFFSAYTSRFAIANSGAIRFGPGTFFGSYGDAQSAVYVLRGTSSGAGSAELFQANGQRLGVPSQSTWTFRVFVAGRASNGKAAGYCFRGFLENEGGVVRQLESINTEDLVEDDSSWNADVTVSDAYDALVITVHGASGDSARWTAVVSTCEVRW